MNNNRQKFYEQKNIRRALIRKGWMSMANSSKALLVIFAMIILSGMIICVSALCQFFGGAKEGIYLIKAIMQLAFGLICIVIFGFILPYFIGNPFEQARVNNALHAAGITNSLGEAPFLQKVERYYNSCFGRYDVWFFDSNGLSLDQWQAKLPALETALKVKINNCTYGDKVNIIALTVIGPDMNLPTKIVWQDKYLPVDDSVYILGYALPSHLVEYNTDAEPNICIAGTTGSGKTNLVKTMIHQAILRGTEVYLIDKKNGADYGRAIRDHVTMLTENKDIVEQLQNIVDVMEHRFAIFGNCENADNIKEYRALGNAMRRILIVVDEMADVTIGKGLSTEEKKTTEKICALLSTIARRGRAAGITLVCSTQRPDQDALPRQIASNLNVRVCGKADANLSRVVFGDERADTLVPKDIRGRFLKDDGTQFQAYMYPKEKASGDTASSTRDANHN